MKFRSTILTIADVSHIKTLPDAYVTMLLLKVHAGKIEKGDVAGFNGIVRDVLDVATNTDFFDQHTDGSVGIAVGGPPINSADAIGRSLVVEAD